MDLRRTDGQDGQDGRKDKRTTRKHNVPPVIPGGKLVITKFEMGNFRFISIVCVTMVTVVMSVCYHIGYTIRWQTIKHLITILQLGVDGNDFFYLQIPPLGRRTVVLLLAATTSAAPNPRACIYHSAAH